MQALLGAQCTTVVKIMPYIFSLVEDDSVFPLKLRLCNTEYTGT
jgi:hypothetical protein